MSDDESVGIFTRLAARTPTLPAWLRKDRLATVLAIALASRVGVVLVAALAGGFFPHSAGGWNRGPGFIRYFARWDSGFYMDIAELGYGFKPEAWAFNPGYSILIAATKFVFPFLDYPTAGFLVSNVAFFGAIAVFYKLTTRLFDEPFAWRATLILAFSAPAFYMSAVYADALFMLLLVGTFLALSHERWLTAGLLASAAAFTRPPGGLLVGAIGLAILVRLYRARKFEWRPWFALPIALTLPALLMLYQWRATGDRLASVHAREVYWPNVEWHNPLNMFDLAGVAPVLKNLMIGSLILLAIALAWSVWDVVRHRRLDAIPAVGFSLVLGTIYLGYSEPNPIVRYLLSMLPVFWLLAAVGSRRSLFVGITAGGALLTAFVASVFATWGPLY